MRRVIDALHLDADEYRAPHGLFGFHAGKLARTANRRALPWQPGRLIRTGDNLGLIAAGPCRNIVSKYGLTQKQAARRTP
jgi:hypothetical protein